MGYEGMDYKSLTLSKGMLYFFRIDGEISVILWRRKASQPCELPGKKPAGRDKNVLL